MSELVQARIGRATDRKFMAALLHHQQRAVSSGEGAGCEHWGFMHTHIYSTVVVCSLASNIRLGGSSKFIVQYHLELGEQRSSY